MSANERFYLKVEAVNLSNFVYDTDNLSTIRGGGLMLLEIPDKVREMLHGEEDINGLKTISQGASWGLFSFRLKDPNNSRLPSMVAGRIRENLNKDLEIYKEKISKEFFIGDGSKEKRELSCQLAPKHATVMVEVTGPFEDKDFEKAKKELDAMVRWQQMRSPGVACPSVEEKAVTVENDGEQKSVRVCELDHVRPAAKASPHRINGRKRGVSESCYSRYKYGVWGKSDAWYDKTTGLDIPYLFTHEFNEITSNGPQEVENLHNKMAVIYFDGNSFGKLLDELCTSPERQEKFDKALRTYQKHALGAILKKIQQDEDGWINQECNHPEKEEKVPKIRLETLLWGGDEVIWVAPAWRGWWLLGEYFRLVEGGLDGSPWAFEGRRLTFAAGMVFCHHKAPIYRIKQMAEGLVYEVKSCNRTRNMAAHEVMESFDFAGPDLYRHRERRRPRSIHKKSMIIDGPNMLDIAWLFSAIKEKIPRRALHRLVMALYGEEPGKALEKFNLVLESALSSEDKACLDCLRACFHNREQAMWLHIHELWDYLVFPGAAGAPGKATSEKEGGKGHVQG